MSSKLVTHITPETHPDILKLCTVSATNNSILNTSSRRFFTFIPRNFATVLDIKDHLDPVETHTPKKTVGQVVKENIPEIFYHLVIGGLETGFLIWLNYIILPLAMAIIPMTLFALAFIGFSIIRLREKLNEEPEPCTTPNKDFLFLQTHRTLLKDLDLADAHDSVAQTINAIHNTDNRLLHNTDTFALAHAYDEYTDMLVFVLANKDKLSPHLVDKYVQSLLNKVKAVEQEAAHVLDSIKTQQEFVLQATKESKRLHQEMLDAEAESIMPPE